MWSAPAASTTSGTSAREDGVWFCANRSMRRIASTRLTHSPRSSSTLLQSFPEGYRHLAYLQTRIGYTVKPDMPGIDGPELAALYDRGGHWLTRNLSVPF